MNTPLQGAGYLHLPKRYRTKEEVLQMLKEHVANGCNGVRESRDERMLRKYQQRHAAAVWHANTIARPYWQITGPVRPFEYTEERLRNYIGRYGSTRND